MLSCVSSNKLTIGNVKRFQLKKLKKDKKGWYYQQWQSLPHLHYLLFQALLIFIMLWKCAFLIN